MQLCEAVEIVTSAIVWTKNGITLSSNILYIIRFEKSAIVPWRTNTSKGLGYRNLSARESFVYSQHTPTSTADCSRVNTVVQQMLKPWLGFRGAEYNGEKYNSTVLDLTTYNQITLENIKRRPLPAEIQLRGSGGTPGVAVRAA